MGVWSTYEARLGVPEDLQGYGDPRRESTYDHAYGKIQRKLPRSLSYKKVTIENEERRVAIMDITGDFTTKKIFSRPGEDLPHGSIVKWNDTLWLITEVDAHKELYTEGRMRECNYNLRWLDDDGNIIGRWCVVEDGTKYLIGEKQMGMMAIGDARIAVTIGKDSDTNKLGRGRRFLIDDLDTKDVLAYQITKPNKLFNVYNGKGVFRFILNEVNLTDDDNVDLRIADYYNWKPKIEKPVSDTKIDSPIEDIVSDAKDKLENTPTNIKESGVWI